MLTEEQRALADGGSWADTKVDEHEAAAHQKRNWVRLTFDCNDRCIFCLDSDAHDGTNRDPNEVKAQILDGRRKGAERLILSGGEPTIHPRFADFVRLGRLAGYERVQTVTNGRMFKYEPFLTKCLDEGLQEITFSIHGPNAKVHDALVGVKGAYEEEIQGLENAFADGRPIINVDICVNRGNVKHLPAMIEGLYAKGVKEFDLLHVIPFGNAWRDGKEVLFYDLKDAREHLVAAFSWAKREDVHIWLNRFPVEHLEGFHTLIQDPYKLNDEIRGRKEEYARWIETGEALDCRDPRRCKHCYLEHVCDTFEATQKTLLAPEFEVLRVDAEWEGQQAPVYGGDPASAKKRRLPMVKLQYQAPSALVKSAGATRLRVVAHDLAAAWAHVATYSESLGEDGELEFELKEVSDFAAQYKNLKAADKNIVRIDVFRTEAAQHLLSMDASFRVGIALTKETAPWLLSLADDAPELSRLALFQPTWERATDARDHDVSVVDFFAEFGAKAPIRGLPRCVAGGAFEAEAKTMDAAMLEPDGKLEAFRFIRRYIESRYRTKSLRCETCVHAGECEGMHVSHVRSHGFDMMQPIEVQPIEEARPAEGATASE